MRCVGGVGRFLDGSIEGEGVTWRGEEGCEVLVEGFDGTMSRDERIYDDIDELRSAMSDMLRYEAMVIKCVEALSFGCKLVVVNTPRRTGRGSRAGTDELVVVQRKYSVRFTSPCMHRSF
jgi:hypothetical protein